MEKRGGKDVLFSGTAKDRFVVVLQLFNSFTDTVKLNGIFMQ